MGPWTCSASVSASDAVYDVRRIATGEVFQRNGLTTELAIDRRINENWKAYMKWIRESDDANDPSYEYEANVFSAGIKWSH